MAKFTRVVADKCISCEACCDSAEEVFSMNDDGVAHNLQGDNTDINAHIDEVEMAEADCPTSAIEVSDSEF